MLYANRFGLSFYVMFILRRKTYFAWFRRNKMFIYLIIWGYYGYVVADFVECDSKAKKIKLHIIMQTSVNSGLSEKI